jgi:imidazolonepropionase-like amidohydrolase
MSLEAFGNPEEITFFTPDQKAKATQVNQGARQMMEWALKHDLLIVTGGDMFGAAYGGRQADNLRILPSVGFTPVQILRTATSNAAEVLSWTGGMNPYKYGTLGTIEPGGYADIILVDGNPLENIDVVARDNVHFVMTDGAIYKNTLD